MATRVNDKNLPPALGVAVPMVSPTLDTVWDALCLAGCGRGKAWLMAFLFHLGWRDALGQVFDSQRLDDVLRQLIRSGRLPAAANQRFDVPPLDRHLALPRILAQPRAQHAWKAWARASATHTASVAEVPRPHYLNREEVQALARLLIYGRLTLDDFTVQRNRVLGFGTPTEALALAWCTPFMPTLWDQADPALHNALMGNVMAAVRLEGPLWLDLLRWHDQRNAQQLHQFNPTLRYFVAQRAMARGDAAAAEQALHLTAGPSVDLARACLPALQGQWAATAGAFAVAFKAASKEARVKRGLAPMEVMLWYALALMQSPQPASWLVAYKLCVSESGQRGADPFRRWGKWAHVIAVRLGDAALIQGVLDAPNLAYQNAPLHADPVAAAHSLVLAAWLNQVPKGWKGDVINRLINDLAQLGQLCWVALVRAAAARLKLLFTEMPAAAASPMALASLPAVMPPTPGGLAVGTPAAQTLAETFFGAERPAWRDALAAIEALGESAVRAAATTDSPPLQWRMQLDADGRVAGLSPFERSATARGLGKPKPVALAKLKKSETLAAVDAAVARCILSSRWSTSRLRLDLASATVALVGHPHLVFDDQPDQPVDLREGLPLLEVRRQRSIDGTGGTGGTGDTGGTAGGTGGAGGTEGTGRTDATDGTDGPPGAECFVFHLADPLGGAPTALRGSVDDDDDTEQEAERRNLLRVVRDAPDRARLIRVNAAQRRVAELVAKAWAVPVDAKAELDAALRVLAGHFQLHSDATAGQELGSEARLRALLSPQGPALQLRLVAQPFGDYGPVVLPGQGRERLLTLHEGLNLATQRQLAQEAAHLQTVLDALPALAGAETGDCTWLLEDPEQALALLELLPQLPAVRDIAWPRGKPVRVQALLAGALRVNVKSGADWLGLNGELQLSEGRVLSLQRLLELAHDSRRSRFIALGEGEYLALTDRLKRQLADLNALAQNDGGGIKLPQAAAAWLAETLDAAVLKGDSPWARRLKQLDQAAALEPEPPASLQAQLRAYQIEGYAWMTRLAHAGMGACLADDMGLGKTVQTLGLLLDRAALGPALVLAPTSVCSNWVAEAARFAPTLKVTLYGEVRAGAETDAGRKTALAQAGIGEVIVASYALMQIDEGAFAAVAWATLVMDEAQALKNAATKRAKAVALLQAGFRLALTGTPVENRLADLWSIMNIVNPGLLGSGNRFAERFAGPIERDRDEPTRLRLRRLVSPFLLRRTKGQVLTDLPPRTEIIHRVEPGPEERAFLEAARRAAQARVAAALLSGADGPGQASFHVLTELTRLRRAACDPRLVAPELGIVGAKVHEFEQLATELVAGRHKALVFSQFTDFLALLAERLKACGLSYQYLDGSTPAAERGKRVEAFQRGEGDLFLISHKAGGFGLNLTAADYVIIVDPWWNPAAEDQALGRAHRIGQQRPVTVYRLVTAGSVEERIVALHGNKRQLADGILADQDSSAPLRADDLRELLRDV